MIIIYHKNLSIERAQNTQAYANLCGHRTIHVVIYQLEMCAGAYPQEVSGRGGLAELLEVDFAITVGIGKVHHLSDNIITDVFAETLKEGGELILGDDSITVGIDGGESLLEFLELVSRKS